MDSILQNIILVSISTLLPTMTAALIAFVVLHLAKLRASINPDRLYQIDRIIEMAVKSAEQLGLSGQILNVGSVLKAQAIKEAQNLLDLYHIKLNAQAIETAIEAAILNGDQKGNGSTSHALRASKFDARETTEAPPVPTTVSG